MLSWLSLIGLRRQARGALDVRSEAGYSVPTFGGRTRGERWWLGVSLKLQYIGQGSDCYEMYALVLLPET